MTRSMALAAGIAALIASAPVATAADYPTKPITLMIGFAPGGPSDVMARILTRKLEELLKQPFVIENRAGAGGSIAGTAVARDGYTVLLAPAACWRSMSASTRIWATTRRRISSRSA